MGFWSGIASSALAGMGGSFSLDDATFGWANNQSNRSLNKQIGQTNIKLQKSYDEWTMQQDKAYEQWWQNYLYDLQNNEYYNLARKYATNTARWAVEGLQAAGLNPVLAAQNPNMSSDLGSAGPNQSGHSISGRSPTASISPSRVGVGLSLKQANAATIESANANTAKTTADTKTVEASREGVVNNLNATNAKTLAEADLVQAQADNVRVQTANSARTEGLTGWPAAAMNVGKKIGGMLDTALSRSAEDVKNFRSYLKSAWESLRTSQQGVSDTPNSAKSLEHVPEIYLPPDIQRGTGKPVYYGPSKPEEIRFNRSRKFFSPIFTR